MWSALTATTCFLIILMKYAFEWGSVSASVLPATYGMTEGCRLSCLSVSLFYRNLHTCACSLWQCTLCDTRHERELVTSS